MHSLRQNPYQRLFLIFLVFFWATGNASGRTITDKRGRIIPADKPFQRVISLYSAHTENLFQLGASDQIIGVSVNDTYPPEVDKKPRFSYHDGPEKYLAAKPDLDAYQQKHHQEEIRPAIYLREQAQQQ